MVPPVWRQERPSITLSAQEEVQLQIVSPHRCQAPGPWEASDAAQLPKAWQPHFSVLAGSKAAPIFLTSRDSSQARGSACGSPRCAPVSACVEWKRAPMRPPPSSPAEMRGYEQICLRIPSPRSGLRLCGMEKGANAPATKPDRKGSAPATPSEPRRHHGGTMPRPHGMPPWRRSRPCPVFTSRDSSQARGSACGSPRCAPVSACVEWKRAPTRPPPSSPAETRAQREDLPQESRGRARVLATP